MRTTQSYQSSPASSSGMVASGSRNGLPPTKTYGEWIIEDLFPDGTNNDPFAGAIDASRLAAECFRLIWNPDLLTEQEEVYIIYVDKDYRLIEYKNLFRGSSTQCICDVRLSLRYALLNKACAIFIAHNHPSGDLKPSEADKELTNEFVKVADLIGIRLLDHIILTENDYYSFAEGGLLK